MRISDWSSDVCSSDLAVVRRQVAEVGRLAPQHQHVALAQARVREALGDGALAPPQPHDDGFELAREIQLADGSSEKLRTRCDHRLHQLQFAFARSEEHTSELQSLMRISYAVFC